MSSKIKEKFKNNSTSNNSCLYFLGIVGASVHYISIAPTFISGVAGFLKALVWPAS